MAKSPITVHVESNELKDLFAMAKAAPGALQVELRRGVAAAALPAVAAVKANSTWSTRIPSAVRAKPFFTAKRAGVTITVDAKKAPEGRPLEHQGQGGTFRHPVFGSKTWVEQPARPFFYHAVLAAPAVDAAMRAVMDRTALKLGFK